MGTQDASNDYPATTTISGIQYDDLAINIEFADTLYDPAEIIGLCNFTVSLDASPDTGSSCGISLVRRADITGDFLQAVAFNVVDATGDATSDALIYYNDGTGELVSTSATGSGGFGTVGYLEMLLKPGSYNFRAEKGGLSSIDVSADIDAAGPGYLLLWLSN